MTDLAIWSIRILVVFCGLATLSFSKRVSLVIFASAFVDFIGILALIVTGPALIFHGSWLFLFGFGIGMSVSIGVERIRAGDSFTVSLVVLTMLKLPFAFDSMGRHDLIAAWPAHLILIGAFPLGLFASAETVNTWRRIRRI